MRARVEELEIQMKLNSQTSSIVFFSSNEIITLRVMNGDFMFNTASYMEDNACWILVVIICWKQVLIIYNGQNITHKHTKLSLTRVDKQSICMYLFVQIYPHCKLGKIYLCSSRLFRDPFPIYFPSPYLWILGLDIVLFVSDCSILWQWPCI